MPRSEPSPPDAAAIARFARVEAMLDAALDQPADTRDAFVRHACGEDAGLCREVLELLGAVDASSGYLEPVETVREPVADAAMQLGPWMLQRPIGRGGSGEVWLGVRNDGQFEQQVAIKLLRDWEPDDVPRFLREQRLLARLDHPGIARLLDAGSTPAGRPYMVMEFIAGTTLTEHVRQRGLGVDARLALFQQVCEAVAFAHRHLIVHRDLKPANVLLGVDGRPRVLDFGIARFTNRRSEPPAPEGVTSEVEFLGTPSYMAPEQWHGQDSPATDIWALGLILYQLLSHTHPFRGLDTVQIVARVGSPEPIDLPPELHAASSDLAPIVMRCLSKLPSDCTM